jgi:hypothetical protein
MYEIEVISDRYDENKFLATHFNANTIIPSFMEIRSVVFALEESDGLHSSEVVCVHFV